MTHKPPHAVCLAFVVALFAVPATAEQIRVAVATNFIATMSALIERFEEGSEHTVVASSGSTGSHYAQIRNGAPYDAFFAADDERPRLLEEEGLIVPGSRFRYAVGRLALWSPRAGYVDDDGQVLASGSFRFLSIANPDLAPYGAAARDVLEARGLWGTLQPRIVRGQDIGQAYSFVSTGNAELGFVAWSQIVRPGAPRSGSLQGSPGGSNEPSPETSPQGSYWLVPESLHRPIAQEAVLLRDRPAVRAFVEFTQSPDAQAIIRSYGYEP